MSKASKTEARSQAAADVNRGKLEKMNSMVDEVLAEMQTDNPPDPIDSLMQRLSRHTTQQAGGDGELTRDASANKFPKELAERPLSIVVFGASGDLAKKKTFSGLFQLFRNGFLPPNTSVIGYARSELSVDDIKNETRLPLDDTEDIDDFFDRVTYVSGQYDEPSDFKKLADHVKQQEQKVSKYCASDAAPQGANRIFYLVVPPDVFLDVAKKVRESLCETGEGWCRLIVEKPFGKDEKSSEKLTAELLKLFKEEQMCRIDHYLGKEMLRAILTLRFANHIFQSVWNRDHIDNVQIIFKETEGVKGRGDYYDKFGVIRDVMQNHLIQILAMVAMEKPKSLACEDIRDARTELLKAVRPCEASSCILGQYTAPPDESEKGYLEEDNVDKDSNMPTFAAFPLFVDNDRWRGVPFCFRSGKALNEKIAVVRIQFKEESFANGTCRNELVIRIQPDEAIYLTMGGKAPGIDGEDLITTDLDLTYKERFRAVRIPEAYEPLLFEAIAGDMTSCVRSDELQAAWRIFTPLLEKIDRRELKPAPYTMGSRGPEGVDELASRHGFRKVKDYKWRKHGSKPDEKEDDQQRDAEAKHGQFQAVKEKATG